MATSNRLKKIGQGFSGVFLGLTGSWLLVICLGGILTLGVLSLFHLGVLLSIGCMGVCFLVAGVCLLYGALSSGDPKKTPPALEADAEDASQLQDDVKKRATTYTAPFLSRLNPQSHVREADKSKKHPSSQFTYNPFNE